MSNRWFRWYDGTCEDGKFKTVTRLSRVTGCDYVVTYRDVIAVWAFLLEDASHWDHRGVCKRNEDFIASVLEFPDGVVEAILSAMQDLDMIRVEHFDITICNWDKRQFESDADRTAARRQRERRERIKNDPSRASNEPVTRDTGGSDTDTDTDKNIVCPVGKPTRTKNSYPEGFEKFWKDYPRTPTMSKTETLKAWQKLSEDERLLACQAIEPYRRFLKSKPNLETVHACRFLSQRRFEGFGDAPAAQVLDIRGHFV